MEKVNSHFIQKGFAKAWANKDNKVNYLVHGTDQGGIFDISSNAAKQPIASLGFYSMEIEKGINELESDGVLAIRKIIASSDKLSFTRWDSVVVRHYFMLNILRSSLSRENIKNLDGDKMFNDLMKKESGTPQEIQERKMRVLIDSYKKNKSGDFSEIALVSLLKVIDEGSATVEDHVNLQLWQTLSARMIPVEFTDGEIFLTENGSFQEISEVISPAAKYDFFPISPNKGIMFVRQNYLEKILGKKAEESVIFTFSTNVLNEAKYVRKAEMDIDHVNFLISKNPKNDEEVIEATLEWNATRATDFRDLKDEFIYIWQKQDKEVANKCNAMMLVHCKGSMVIFQNINNYFDATVMIEKLGIYRIEETNR